jgi:hypothetical protein
MDFPPTGNQKSYMDQRRQALFNERSSFISHYMEISRFIRPRSGRYFTSDVNRGDKRYQSIINSRGTQASRTARAGLFAGVMSPSRRWFKLETPDPDLMKSNPVQDWLYKVETLLGAIFNSSNLYNMAPVTLGELLDFGTGAISQVDDFDDVCRFYSHTVGSYMIAQDDRYQVDTFVRDMKLTVRQIASRFGLDGASQTVRNLYDQGNYESWVDVVHFIEPNKNFSPTKPHSAYKAFSSTWYEPGSTKGGTNLSDKGYDEFPIHVPRWDVTGEDIYATDCPGMTALGDIKGLQAMERMKAKAIEKMVDPPLVGPPSLHGIPNTLPGGVTVYEAGPNNQKLESIYNIRPDLQQHLMDIQHIEGRIDNAYYVDLFRSIDSMEGVQPQNQLFLSMKNAEKLLQLGPVLERIHGEFLNSMVDRTFSQCYRAGILPPAPPELQGKPLKTRYISSLAMAQKEVATQSIDKLTMFIGGLVQMGATSALDKFDVDTTIEQYASALGVSPQVIMDEDKVLAARKAKQQQADQQHQMAMMQQGAGAAQQAAQAVGSLAGAGAQGAPTQ